MRLCRECAEKALSCLALFLRYTTIHWEGTTWDATAKPLPPNCSACDSRNTAYLNYFAVMTTTSIHTACLVSTAIDAQYANFASLEF
jgi:hypothetical protein